MEARQVAGRLKGSVQHQKMSQASAFPVGNKNVLSDIPMDHHRWKAVLAALCKRFNGMNYELSKTVSNKTMEEREQFLYAFFRDLRNNEDRAFRIDPRQLGDRHVRWMFSEWIQRELSVATLKNYLSYLRVFEKWIGKPGMVREMEFYSSHRGVGSRRIAVATEDRSWTPDKIDRDAVLARADEMDAWVGAQLRMQSSFGLRVKESIMFRPHQDAGEGVIRFTRGTKGGRQREVAIVTDDQRAALALAKRLVVSEDGYLAEPTRDLKGNYNRFYNVLRELGITRAESNVTAHGLRHGYAGRKYLAVTGVAAPVAGGEAIDSELDTLGRLAVAEDLGHGRKQISSAYLGGVLKKKAGTSQAALLNGNDDASVVRPHHMSNRSAV